MRKAESTLFFEYTLPSIIGPMYNCNNMQRLICLGFLGAAMVAFAQQPGAEQTSPKCEATDAPCLLRALRVETLKRIKSDVGNVQAQVQTFQSQVLPPLQKEKDQLYAEICGEAKIERAECDVDEATATAKKKEPPQKPATAAAPAPPPVTANP
jgi:hypothetical protein